MLVDCENLYHAAMEEEHGTIDFWKLIEILVNDRDLVRAMAFLNRRKGDDKFINALKTMGYTIYTPERKMDTDVQMAVKAISIAQQVDAEVLVTGDADFLPVCKYLRTHGIKVELAQYRNSVNSALLSIVDKFTALNKKDVIIKEGRGR